MMSPVFTDPSSEHVVPRRTKVFLSRGTARYNALFMLTTLEQVFYCFLFSVGKDQERQHGPECGGKKEEALYALSDNCCPPFIRDHEGND